MTAPLRDRAHPLSTGRTLRVASRVAGSGPVVSRLLWGSGPRRVDEERGLRHATVRLGAACADLCDTHGIRIVVRGRPPVGAAALVSNHVGYVDPLAIMACVPAAPVAKREVSEWPLVGTAMDRAGVLWVDRACPVSGAIILRRAMRAFAADVPVLVFPEGTTSHGDDALPFRRGLFGAAILAGVPVVPVSLRYCSRTIAWVGDEDFLPHYLRTAGRPETTATVRFHPPVVPRPGERAHDLAARAREVIRAGLREAPPS